MRLLLVESIYLLITARVVLSFWSPPSGMSPPPIILRNQISIWPRNIPGASSNAAQVTFCNKPLGSSHLTSADEFDTESYRESAFRVADSFQPREFRPASPLLANKHVQTISGALLRNVNSCRYVTVDADQQEIDTFGFCLRLFASAVQTPKTTTIESNNDILNFWDKRERIETLDGDFFHVDSKFCHGKEDNLSTKGLVIIVHGLQSNSNSSLVLDMATAYGNKGFDVACINFRGCSGEPNDRLKAYHLGFTDDIKYYLSLLSKRKDSSKPSAIFITGKSLGANVVLNALGELGMSAITDYNVRGAAVNCVPFDNERNKDFLLQGFSKIVYNGKLLQSLRETAFCQLERFSDTEDAQKVNSDLLAKVTTITEFDDVYIAPLFGFQNYQEYYNKSSCLNFLDKIRVPTLILNSADDPFMDPSFFPWEYGCDSDVGQRTKSPIKMVRSKHGGHLGYMFHSIIRPSSQPDGDNQSNDAENMEVSFMPSEMARFIDYCIRTS